MQRTLLIVLTTVVVLAGGTLAWLFWPEPNQLPTAFFTAEPEEGQAPFKVTFDASGSSDPDGSIVQYTWDFGDGQTGEGPHMEHTYPSPGTFTATLTVVDDQGATHTTTRQIIAHRLPVPPKDWQSVIEPETPYPPLLTGIEPPDGSIIRATETWIRWNRSDEAEGRVLWHKAGESEVHIAEATTGEMLSARLQPLEIGATYEYVVEQFIGELAQRSDLRTFMVQGGVVFDPPVVEATIERDHSQTVTLRLRNSTDEKVTVAAKSLKQIEDLPADIVGPGSVDDPVELGAGKEMPLLLSVYAADATKHTYEIPVEAAGAVGRANVKVGMPKLDLAFRVVREDPRTLAQWIEVSNVGDTLTDLALRVVPPHDDDVRLEPVTGYARLAAGDALEIVATPVLYLEFDALEAEIEATAAGQSMRFPIEFHAPPDKRLMAARSHSTETTSGNQLYCSPVKCTDIPGPGGTGPAITPPADVIGPAASRMSPIRRAKEETAQGIKGIRLASIGDIAHTLFAQVSPEGDQTRPGGNEHSGSLPPVDSDKNGEEQVNEGKCEELKCTQEDMASAFREARRLQRKYKRIKARRDRNLQQAEAFERLRSTPGHQRLQDFYQARADDLSRQLGQIHAEYHALREKIYAVCGILLPDLGAPPYELPRDRDLPCEEYISRYRGLPDEQKKHLPDDYASLPCYKQRTKYEALSSARGHLAAAEKFLRCYQAAGGVPGDWEDLPSPSRGLDRYRVECQMHYFQRRASAFSDLEKAKDPPSDQFDEVVRPVPPPSISLEPETETEGLNHEALKAGYWKLTYMHAWLRSFERYQGAELAGETDAMVRQAQAMVRYGDLIVNAARTHAQKSREFEQIVLPKLVAALEAVHAEMGFEAAVERYRGRVENLGLPEEQQEWLRDLGIPESEIENPGQRMLEVTPEQLKANLEDLRAEVEQIETLREVRENAPEELEIEPGEVLDALYLQSLSNELLYRAELLQLRVAQPPAEPAVQVRHGLLEALQRRASFSREHRGPLLAASIVGDTSSSAAYTNGYHADNRIVFAWHQNDDQIIFAALDPRGKMVTKPKLVGSGHWPRITADGDRTAVAWKKSDGFMVRLHDGNAWGDEIPLPGREATIRFAPAGGPLYAATTTGLWRLNGGEFEQVREAEYTQSTLAVDNKGEPHVAWLREGQILYEGETVSEGEHPSILFTPEGTLYLAYLSEGALFIRHRQDGQWSQPEEIPAENPHWPTLALGEGNEVRVSYIGDAEIGPPALWLVRLPDKEPILMPSLAGNVTDAWFSLTIDLNFPRSHYRPMDILVTVNDVWVKLFQDAVPEGRYLFRLDPSQVFTSSGQPAWNRIGVHRWYGNAGANVMWANYKLTVRRAWSEYYGFASSPEEVIEAHEATHRINHDQPDLALVANALDLPVKTPNGPIDLPVTIVNLGEGDSEPAKLVMQGDGERLQAAKIPLLKPGEQMVLNMRVNGHLTRARFRIEYDDHWYRDFDPGNDSLSLRLWSKRDYQQIERTSPAPEKPEAVVVSYPNDVQPPWIAGALPAGAKTIGEWEWHHFPAYQTVPSHSSGVTKGRSLHYFIRADEILPLASGDNLVQYVYLDPDSPPQQILLQPFLEGRHEGQALYWGGDEDLIRIGGQTAERVGDLPEPGRWVRLKIPIERFGIDSAWIDGLLFGHYDGRAYWGPTAKSIERLDNSPRLMVFARD